MSTSVVTPVSKASPVIVGPEDRPWINVLGTRVRLILTAADTGGFLTVTEQKGAPGVGVPTHIHTREDEIFQILEGELEITVSGKPHRVSAGTTVLAPRNIPHSFLITGDQEAHFLVQIAPSGMERMFEELSALPPGPPDPVRVGEICARYGITFL